MKLLTYAAENPGFVLDRQHLLQLLQYVKAGAAQGAEPSALRGALEEIAAMEYDKWSNGARAGEIARNALAMQSQSIPVTGATVADRLDAMADREQAGSQASSDLYAAATVWRKHLKAGAAQGADTRDDLLAQMRAYVNLIKGAALQGPSFFTEERCRNLFEECVRLNGAYLSLPAAQGVEPGAKRWNDALEVAARICESVNNHDNPMTANDCADAIRARKELPPTGTEKKA